MTSRRKTFRRATLRKALQTGWQLDPDGWFSRPVYPADLRRSRDRVPVFIGARVRARWNFDALAFDAERPQ